MLLLLLSSSRGQIVRSHEVRVQSIAEEAVLEVQDVVLGLAVVTKQLRVKLAAVLLRYPVEVEVCGDITEVAYYSC